MPKRLLDQRWPWLVAAGAIVVAFLATFIQIRLPGPIDPRPVGSVDDIAHLRDRGDLNVLLIVIDMLRADRLGCYGYRRDTSPALDRLAHTGVRFARQISQSSWTKASMASLFTGYNPTRTGITRFDHVIPDAAEMPPEILGRVGFQAVGIYRNGWVAPTFGFGQGYDIYERPVARPVPQTVKLANPTITERGTDESAIESALEFLRFDGHRKRWFLYMHLMDVHEYLYDEQSALFGSTHSDIYDNAIRHVDSLIEILLDSLSEAGYRANTLIVVAADHGEALGERGFDGHARELYRESTEVPFLLSFPFRLETGIAVNSVTRNVDIWPTVYDLLHVAPPDGIDGRSLVPQILGAARNELVSDGDHAAFAHLDQTWGRPDLAARPTVAVVDGPNRYVRVEQTNGDVERLYDRSDDPAEMRDRADEEPETMERLRQLADRHLSERPPWGDAPTRKLDELELNHLRALGYAIP